MSDTKIVFRTNCANFIGDKPCIFHIRNGALCLDCAHFRKASDREITRRKKILEWLRSAKAGFSLRQKNKKQKKCRILIIKFGATGDVLRTTPILKTLKARYPLSRITWITNRNSAELLEKNPYIDNLVTASLKNAKKILRGAYDFVFSFDKEPLAIAIATAAKAKKKFGFKMDEYGALNIFDKRSVYAMLLGIDNRLKFRKNKKTYQAIIYEMAGLDLPYGQYILCLDKKYKSFGKNILKRFGVKPNDIVIGFNTGAGRVFLTKKWPVRHFVKLCRLLENIEGVKTLLLGGRDERALNRIIAKKTEGLTINIGTNYSKKEFAGVVDNCDIIVTSDTLCMHLAIALRKKVAALFGPTSAVEVDLYGLGRKMYENLPCAPCYKSRCENVICMKSIKPEMVFSQIKRLVNPVGKSVVKTPILSNGVKR